MKTARLINPKCPALRGCVVEIVGNCRDSRGRFWYKTFNPLSANKTETVDHLPQSLEILPEHHAGVIGAEG